MKKLEKSLKNIRKSYLYGCLALLAPLQAANQIAKPIALSEKEAGDIKKLGIKGSSVIKGKQLQIRKKYSGKHGAFLIHWGKNKAGQPQEYVAKFVTSAEVISYFNAVEENVAPPCIAQGNIGNRTLIIMEKGVPVETRFQEILADMKLTAQQKEDKINSLIIEFFEKLASLNGKKDDIKPQNLVVGKGSQGEDIAYHIDFCPDEETKGYKISKSGNLARALIQSKFSPFLNKQRNRD